MKDVRVAALCSLAFARLFGIMSQWKTDAAKDMYVEESLDNRLEVTKFLGP